MTGDFRSKGLEECRIRVKFSSSHLAVFDDALREFEADIRIDPSRAVFHRYMGLIHQATARPADAADAFRRAWLLDPTDPQNAYRLVVYRSDSTTEPEIDRALAMLALGGAQDPRNGIRRQRRHDEERAARS